MTERITITDVRMRFQHYVEAAAKVGFDTEGWTMQEGSSTYGRAFRIYTATGERAPGAEWAGYIGSTRREAFQALTHMHSLMWEIIELRKGK